MSDTHPSQTPPSPSEPPLSPLADAQLKPLGGEAITTEDAPYQPGPGVPVFKSLGDVQADKPVVPPPTAETASTSARDGDSPTPPLFDLVSWLLPVHRFVTSVGDRLFRRKWLGYLVTLLFFFAVWIVIQFTWSRYLAGVDGDYHMKMGYLYRTQGPLAFDSGRFECAYFSIFRDHWADKEWGFHQLLALFTIGWDEPAPHLGTVPMPESTLVAMPKAATITAGQVYNVGYGSGSPTVATFTVQDPVDYTNHTMLKAVGLDPASARYVRGRLKREIGNSPIRVGMQVSDGRGVNGTLAAIHVGTALLPKAAANDPVMPIREGALLAVVIEGLVSGRAILGPVAPNDLLLGPDAAAMTSHYILINHWSNRAELLATMFEDKPITLEDHRAFLDPHQDDMIEVQWFLNREQNRFKDTPDGKAFERAKQVWTHPFIHGELPFTGQDTLLKRGKFANAFLIALLCTVFVIFFVEYKLPYSWALTLFLFVGADFFWWRFFMCRAHMLSVPMIFLGLLFALRGQRIAILLLGIVYALSYTAAHALVVTAVLVGLTRFIAGDPTLKFRWLPTWLCAAIGVGIGFLLHPNFFNNLYVFSIQNGAVYTSSFGKPVANWLMENLGRIIEIPDHFRDLLTPRENLRLGRELDPPGGSEVFYGYWMIWLPAAVLTLGFALRGLKPQMRTVVAFVFALAWFIMFIFSMRFVEYLGPAVALYLAFAVVDHVRATDFNRWFDQQPWRANFIVLPMTVFLVAAVVLGFSKGYDVVRSNDHRPEPWEPALYLRSSAPKGAQVFTSDWHHFVGAIHFSHHQRYLLGLDPTFMFFFKGDPTQKRQVGEIWRLWSAIRNGEKLINDVDQRDAQGKEISKKLREWDEIIVNTFKADYVMVEHHAKDFIRNMEDKPERFTKIYTGEEFMLFKVRKD